MPQILRPTYSQTRPGLYAWNSTIPVTTVWSRVDEVIPNDTLADTAYTTVGSLNGLQIGFPLPPKPPNWTSTSAIRCRLRVSVVDGNGNPSSTGNTVTTNYRLYINGVYVTGGLFNNLCPQTGQYELVEFDTPWTNTSPAISTLVADFFVTSQTSGNASLKRGWGISWIELEVPDEATILITATAGAFPVAGTAINRKWLRRLTAVAASLPVNGTAAGLRVETYPFYPQPGSFPVAGNVYTVLERRKQIIEVGSATFSVGNNNVSLPWPANCQNSDLGILAVETNQLSTDLSVPSGFFADSLSTGTWRPLYTQYPDQSGGDTQLYVFYGWFSTDGISRNDTVISGGGGYHKSVILYVFRNNHGSQPILNVQDKSVFVAGQGTTHSVGLESPWVDFSELSLNIDYKLEEFYSTGDRGGTKNNLWISILSRASDSNTTNYFSAGGQSGYYGNFSKRVEAGTNTLDGGGVALFAGKIFESFAIQAGFPGNLQVINSTDFGHAAICFELVADSNLRRLHARPCREFRLILLGTYPATLRRNRVLTAQTGSLPLAAPATQLEINLKQLQGAAGLFPISSQPIALLHTGVTVPSTDGATGGVSNNTLLITSVVTAPGTCEILIIRSIRSAWINNPYAMFVNPYDYKFLTYSIPVGTASGYPDSYMYVFYRVHGDAPSPNVTVNAVPYNDTFNTAAYYVSNSHRRDPIRNVVDFTETTLTERGEFLNANLVNEPQYTEETALLESVSSDFALAINDVNDRKLHAGSALVALVVAYGFPDKTALTGYSPSDGFITPPFEQYIGSYSVAYMGVLSRFLHSASYSIQKVDPNGPCAGLIFEVVAQNNITRFRARKGSSIPVTGNAVTFTIGSAPNKVLSAQFGVVPSAGVSALSSRRRRYQIIT